MPNQCFHKTGHPLLFPPHFHRNTPPCKTIYFCIGFGNGSSACHCLGFYDTFFHAYSPLFRFCKSCDNSRTQMLLSVSYLKLSMNSPVQRRLSLTEVNAVCLGTKINPVAHFYKPGQRPLSIFVGYLPAIQVSRKV